MIRQKYGTSVEVSVRLKIDMNTGVLRVRSCQLHGRGADGESTAAFVAGLLDPNGGGAGRGGGRRALRSFAQAVMVQRWFLDGTRVAQLARDNQVSSSTAFRCLHEVIDVLAAVAPGVQGALLAAHRRAHPRQPGRDLDPHRPVEDGRPDRRGRCGGRASIIITGRTSRCSPDGRTLWTSLVRVGREHDTTCARAHAGLLDALSDWTDWSIGAHLGRVIGETARTSRYPQPQLVTEPHA